MHKERSGLKVAYDHRLFDKAPPTYTDAEFLNKIIAAVDFNSLPTPARIADVMSGPGKVGLVLQKQFPKHHYYFLDFARGQLMKIPGEGKIAADARALPLAPECLDAVVVRYALKDLTEKEQPEVLKGIFQVLKPGGRLVIADMVAPNNCQSWLNKQHALKQTFSGRREDEGRCHIPTTNQWFKMLRKTGFHVELVDDHKSYVTTNDWLLSSQVNEAQLSDLNKTILAAPQDVREAFNIRQEGGLVKIDYPIIIIKAVKPVN